MPFIVQGRPHFTALDSLRGICALIVALYHFSADSFISCIPFVKNGFLFVDFFFVLSGFVIAASYERRLRNGFPVSRFMFLRLGRVYPIHLFVLVLYSAVALSKPASGYSASGFLVTVFLFQTFSNGSVDSWNPPSWSISAEIWTYLAFAIVLKVAKQRYLQVLCLAVGISPFLLMLFTDRYIDVCFAGSLFRCFLGFSLGALAHSAYILRKVGFSGAMSTIAELALLLCSAIAVSLAGAGPISFLCPFIFAATVYLIAREDGFISQLLRGRPFIFLGQISYSIYMTHMFVQARLYNIVGYVAAHYSLPILKLPNPAQTIVNLPGHYMAADFTEIIMLVTVVSCASLSYRYIEEPFRLRSRLLAEYWWRTAPIAPSAI